MKIPLVFVQSSNINSMGYDDASQTMAIQFKGGKTYHYAGVPKEVFEFVRDSESVGREFLISIRDCYDGVLQP